MLTAGNKLSLFPNLESPILCTLSNPYASGDTQSFNKTGFASVGSITLSSLVGTPVRFIRWGDNGLALATYNKNFCASGGSCGDVVDRQRRRLRQLQRKAGQG
jgi:hypothetical protein